MTSLILLSRSTVFGLSSPPCRCAGERQVKGGGSPSSSRLLGRCGRGCRYRWHPATRRTNALIGTSNFDAYDLSASLSAETIDGNSVLIADPAGIGTQVDNLLRPPTDAPADAPILNHQDAIDPPTTSC